jgi:hypothetical protein
MLKEQLINVLDTLTPREEKVLDLDLDLMMEELELWRKLEKNLM